jgi:hypothetical protein
VNRIFKHLFATSILLVAFACAQTASAASIIYDGFFTNVFGGNILVNSNTFKCMLVTSSYTQNKGTHAARSDITNEVSGTGYTAGGATCTVSGAVDTTNHRYDITITGPSWTTSTITARQMIVYKSTGTASTDYLVGAIDFGSDVTSTASTFQVTVTSPLRIQN